MFEKSGSKKNEIYPYQSFSNNNIFIPINEIILKTQKKEELINFSFKKKDEKNNKNTLTKEQKNNDLNIYSKNDKNIHKSGHFAGSNNTKKIKIIKNARNKNNKYLIKNLFTTELKNVDNIQIINNNKENINRSNFNENYFNTVDSSRDNIFEKIQTKIKYIMPIKKERIQQNNLHNTSLLNKRLFKKINIETNKSKYKTKNNTIIKSSKPKLLKNNIIKINKNKLFISSKTNLFLKNKNINIKSSNKNISNSKIINKSYINKSFDFNEKKITDNLYNKINHINKKITLFSEYNKELQKQLKNLNKELSSFESNKSKKIIKNDKNKTFITVSPYKNKSSVFNSEIKNILFNKKIKNIKNITSLNKKSINICHSNANSSSNISEFEIGSNKKNITKNNDISRNKIFEKSIKKRRIKTNSIFESIHIKII